VETALVAVAAAGAVMLAMRMRRSPDLDLETPVTVSEEVPDLPCPWCEAPTSEEDALCPSCGRRFGPLVCR
jgi:hypothetical protein